MDPDDRHTTGDHAHAGEKPAPSREMIEFALDAGHMVLWHLDFASQTVTGEGAWARTWGIPDPGPKGVSRQELMALVHPDDRERIEGGFQRALSANEGVDVEFQVSREDDDAPRWLGGRGKVIELAGDGSPKTMVGVNWDITQRKRQEHSLALSAMEMDHRVKNSFAIMRALVSIGQRSATDLDSFAADLRAQVQAMADAHNLSARLTAKAGKASPDIAVADIMREALAPWQDSGAPVTLYLSDAPRIPAGKVNALAMLAYELTTNAAKHGPLGRFDGTLTVGVEAGTALGAPSCELTWTEHCEGEPFEGHEEDIGAQAGTSGIGSVLITHCITALRARMDRRLTASGLVASLTFPVAAGEADSAKPDELRPA